jgi:hypothetical protein
MSSTPFSDSDLRKSIHDFVVAGAGNELTEELWTDFERLLRGSDDACRLYAGYVGISVLLPAILSSTPDEESPRSDIFAREQQDLAVPSAPGVPCGIWHTTLGYFSEGMPLAYLLATVILGVGLLIGSQIYVSAPGRLATELSPATNEKATRVPHMQLVGRITGMVDCQRVQSPPFGVQSPALDPRLSALVSLGDKFALSSGLMEITYDTGAKVVLQGPVTYEVESANGGYLSVGKLTARVEKRTAVRSTEYEVRSGGIGDAAENQKSEIRNQKLFAVRTPTATVTDLGTEFGVEVDASGQLDVHVFQGVVECGVPATAGVAAQAIRLTEEGALRIAPGGAVIERRSANRGQFTQLKMPTRRPLSLIGFYPFDDDAKDQSGNGNHVGPLGIHGVTFVDGFEGQAARFEPAAGSFIDLPIDASPTAMPRLTWGAWVRPRAVGPKPAEIITNDSMGYGRTVTINDRVGVDGQTTGVFRFAAFLGDQGPDRGIFPSSGPLPTPHAWTFVAIVYDDSSHRVCLFVEDKSLHGNRGGLVEDRTIGVQFGPCHPFIRVGRHADWEFDCADAFDGDIDNLFIFPEVLSARELERVRRDGCAGILAIAQGRD